jgi:NTE family protein
VSDREQNDRGAARRTWDWVKRLVRPEINTVLALSGGAARGLAHIGVLQELDRLGLRPDLVTGTSMGAIVGALYCLNGSSEKLEQIALDTVQSETFKKFNLDDMLEDDSERHDSLSELGVRIRKIVTLTRMARKLSVVDEELMRRVMNDMFRNATFGDLKIPFAAVATDLVSGQDVTITEGLLTRAAQASAAIPGIFPPVKYGEMLLVDGGVTRNVPVPDENVRRQARVVAVTVDYGPIIEGPYDSGLDIVARSDHITQLHLSSFFVERADLVLKPKVGKVHWAAFRDIKSLVELGRESVAGREEELREIFG